MSTNINKVLYKDHTGELIDSCHCSRCYEKRIEGLSLEDRMAVWFQEIMYEEEPPR